MGDLLSDLNNYASCKLAICDKYGLSMLWILYPNDLLYGDLCKTFLLLP